MELSTVQRVLSLLSRAPEIHTVDITGGAPELNPHFKELVVGCRALGKKVLDRCNLSILFEPGQEETAIFLRDHQVQVVASLPCYTKENVEKQRGRGVFGKSIDALLMFNQLGYAQEGSGLELDLVYNPLGAYLPPEQKTLEAKYKSELKEIFGIKFNKLYTITNMPIKRFLWDLEKQGQLESYMQLLLDNFNPDAVGGIMCRDLISISWDGQIYDCDFNQMLKIPHAGKTKSIWDINNFEELKDPIAFANHCYACTAGAGSSCTGTII
jgi:radical SAM/Cys-rich protein